MTSDVITEIDFETHEPSATASQFFRPESGSKYLIAFAMLKPDGKNPRLLHAPCHFKDGVGFVVSRIGKDGPEADKIWERLGEPRDRFATAIYLFPTKAGKLDKHRFDLGIDVCVWDFPGPTYSQFKEFSSQKPLGISTWNISCSGPRKQIEISRGSDVPWERRPDVWAKIQERVKLIEGNIRPAREMTTEELAAKLGIDWPPPEPDPTPPDLSGI